MELDIEVKWTQEDIEKMLRARVEEEGFLMIPQPKVINKDEKGPDAGSTAETKYFVWPRGGPIKVRARAIISPRGQKKVSSGMIVDETPPKRMEPVANDVPLDPTMLPDGVNVDALEAAAKQRPLLKNESRTPPKPGKPSRKAGR